MQRYGIDENVMYYRTRSEVGSLPEKLWKIPKEVIVGNINRNMYSFSSIHVSFCGKLYTGFKYKYYTTPIRSSTDTVEGTVWNSDQIAAILAKIDKDDYIEFNRNKERKNSRWYFRRSFTREKIDALFALNGQETDVEGHQFYKAPVIAGHTQYNPWNLELQATKCEINPCLADLEFYKVMDPYTAWQQLSMFIPGVLGSSDPNTIEIDDKLRAEAHGMDNWSFRRKSHQRKGRK